MFRRMGYLGLLLAVLLCSVTASGQVRDPQVWPNAAIQAFKIYYPYASDAAYVAARTASYNSKGLAAPALAEGEIYYRTSDNALRYYDGAAWQSMAGGGGGESLATTYNIGPAQANNTIARTDALGALKITDSVVGSAVSDLWIARTAGSGAAINIDNTGTGNDITGDLWSVDTSGRATFARVDLGDDEPIRVGASQDVELEWDTTGTDHFQVTPAAANTEIDIGTDGVGMDLLLNTGTAGDYVRFDVSDKLLYFVDAFMKVNDSDPLYFGTATGAANVDGDFSVYYDGTSLQVIPLVAGDDIQFGADGNGVDIAIYGDAAGSSVLFDFNAGGDEVVFTVYDLDINNSKVDLDDDSLLRWGTGLDITTQYAGGTNILEWKQAVAGTGSITYGVDGKGIPTTWYTETASSKIYLDQANDALEFTAANAQFKDGSKTIFGTGAGATGDMQISYAGGTNILSIAQTVADTGTITIGDQAGHVGIDVTLYEDDAGDYWMFDEDSGILLFEDTEASFSDGANLYLGATVPLVPADGFSITGTANDLAINSVAAGGGKTVTIGATADTNFVLDGTAGSITWDHATDTLTCDTTTIKIGDSDKVIVGDGAAGAGDVSLVWDVTTYAAAGLPDGTGGLTGLGAVVHVEDVAAAANNMWTFGVDGEGQSMVLMSETAGDYTWFNQAANEFEMVDGTIKLQDGTTVTTPNDAIVFGADDDVALGFNGTQMVIGPTAATTDMPLWIGSSHTRAMDVVWYGGNATSVQLTADAAGGYQLNSGTPLIFGTSAGAHFGVAVPDPAPASGVQIKGGANELYIDANAAGANVAYVGYDGVAANDMDMSWYGTNGAGADAVEMTWDYGNDRLSFSNSGGIFLPDTTSIEFGNVVGTPDIDIQWDAAKLLVDTGGAANAIVQFGAEVANHQVTVEFGNKTSKGIVVDANKTAGAQIEYYTQRPRQQIWIPAGSFAPGGNGATADAAWGEMGNVAGLLFNHTTEEGAQTTWMPDLWVAEASDIGAQIMWATTATGCDVHWTISYKAMVPGTSQTDDGDGADTDVSVTDAADAAQDIIMETTEMVVGNADVITNAHRPIRIYVTRDDLAGTDTCNAAEAVFLGVTLSVYRQYGD